MKKKNHVLKQSKEGILLVNKSKGRPSFHLVRILRKLTNIKKIGHAGTLDPFATGLMVLLIGREYTKKSAHLINMDKEYIASLELGVATDSYDLDGSITRESDFVPSFEQVENVLSRFQGTIKQTPPMYSAKKVGGQKLYNLARKGQTIEREASLIELTTTLIHYEYPIIKLHITCSKGTYVRSIAHDMGLILGCFAHLVELERVRCGQFHLKDAVDQTKLDENFQMDKWLMR